MKQTETTCQLCGEDNLADVWLPDVNGAMTARSGLVMCAECRVVMQPPSIQGPEPRRDFPARG